MTHEDLVKLGASWLKYSKRMTVVLADFRSISTWEQPDVIGWKGNGWSVLVECKASRSDFLRDKQKRFRRQASAMGQLRYYLCPPDVIKPEDLPDNWGLLYADGKRVKAVREPLGQWHPDRCKTELPMVLAALRRVLRNGGSLEYEAPAEIRCGQPGCKRARMRNRLGCRLHHPLQL